MSWSSYAVGDDEADSIDNVRPGTRFTSSRVQQLDQPGENLLSGVVNVKPPVLPDPTVGGQYGSTHRNAMTFGLVRTMRQRLRPFSGQVVAMPAVAANPVQGNVGRAQGHQDQLAAGVRDQFTNYTGSLKSFAESMRVLGATRATGTQVGTDLPEGTQHG